MAAFEGTLQSNLREVRDRLAAACARAGREARDVRLVAVTKTVSAAEARALLSMGITDIGENRVQEAERKFADIGAGPTWHMIGHLQTNKVRKALAIFSILHSVDSVRLAEAISEEAAKRNRVVDVMLEVNVSGEETKSGFPPDAVAGAVSRIAELPGIRLAGLMTMAPLADDPETCRPLFRRLKELRDTLNAGLPGLALRELSMGMTQDYEVAVEEGATIVRVGSALFRGLV